MLRTPWCTHAVGLTLTLVCVLPLAAQQNTTPAVRPVPAVQIGGAAPAQKQFADTPATHEKTGEVKVQSSDGKYRLQTLGIDAQGRVLALAGPPKGFGPPVKGATAEVQVFAPEGKALFTINLDFHATAVAGGPDGNIYVAGAGKVAKFSREGKPMSVTELPYIQELLKDKDGPRKQAEQQLKLQRQSIENIVKTYKARVETLEAKKEENRSPLEKKQLDQFKQILKTYEPRLGNDEAMIEQIVGQMTGRLYTVNALTFSSKDVFVATGDTKGFGYAIWRMDQDFKNSKQVLSGVRGCCGQMDIQTSGLDLLVAENTNHRFARYDRDGKQLATGGKRAARQGELECFGGCCNPMNVRGTSSGDVFTAESEGFIKRFSGKGDFLGLVATVPLTGAGCKNVAFAVSPNERNIYFLDLNGSRFLILSQKAATK